MSDQLILGGKPLPRALDDIRRYCGLTWSGGPPEVWAYHYFDAQPSEPDDVVTPGDVLATAALHSGLTKRDLTYFVRRGELLTRLLHQLPIDRDLADAGPEVLATIADVGPLTSDSAVGLALLTKVLHRKRPRLVPMAERALFEWYAGQTKSRGVRAWSNIIQALSSDLSATGNLGMLTGLQQDVAPQLPACPSHLRLVDIAIWMEARR